MNLEATTRLVAERELITSKTLELTAGGCSITFCLETINADAKRKLKAGYDERFPVPPVIVHKTPVGTAARFDLESEAYQAKLTEWYESLSYGVLGSTLGLTDDEVRDLENCLPAEFMSELFSTASLINGVQSEPLADIIKDAMWAPEVLAWIETYKAKGDEVQVTDTPLFRQMEAMIEAGFTFRQWDDLSPRERMLVINWHEYKMVREGYISWWTTNKHASPQSPNPMRRMVE